MSFDPEKVKRYWPDNNGNMEEDTYHEGGYVRHEDYAQLKAILHDVATEADPAGTVRELRLAQDTIRAQEVLSRSCGRKLEVSRWQVKPPKISWKSSSR